jgi:hypothetical protein
MSGPRARQMSGAARSAIARIGISRRGKGGEMPDNDGYPTEEELKTFEKWKPNTFDTKTFSVHEIVDHIKAIWWTPDWGFKLHEGRDRLFRKKVMKLELHTGGWSGNEDVIGELQQTMFWILYWVESHRGGHYYFNIPWQAWKGNSIV